MTTSSQTQIHPRAWWSTTPNPPCSPWCEDEHAPDEFQRGAAMSCHRTIAKTQEFEVQVTQYHGGEEDQPGQLYSDPKSVYVYAPSLSDEFLSPDDAQRIVSELSIAIAQAAAEARA